MVGFPQVGAHPLLGTRPKGEGSHQKVLNERLSSFKLLGTTTFALKQAPEQIRLSTWAPEQVKDVGSRDPAFPSSSTLAP